MNNNTAGTMPNNVKNYVYKGTTMVNVVLMLCQIFFAFLFWKYEAHFLVYYNCFSALLFIISWLMLKKGKIQFYIYAVFGGLFGFMVATVVCLGWEFGFQQYCIGFVASLIFTDFYMNRKRRITKRTVVIVTFNVCLYICMRLWTYYHPYIYKIENVWIGRCLYILNSLLGFAFLIGYLLIYSSTVRRLENSLREMANIDPLTGICNRRKMHQIMKNSLEHIEPQPYQAVVAMLDVDFFKKVNDTYGHDAGDEVLLMLAHLLYEKQEKIPGFYVSRWGGEEFLIFYEKYKCDKNKVIEEFNNLREQIKDAVVTVDNKPISITVTMGLAFFEQGETIHNLIKIADDNLYEGKNTGRNKVVS